MRKWAVGKRVYTFPDSRPRIIVEYFVDEGPTRHARCTEDEGKFGHGAPILLDTLEKAKFFDLVVKVISFSVTYQVNWGSRLCWNVSAFTFPRYPETAYLFPVFIRHYPSTAFVPKREIPHTTSKDIGTLHDRTMPKGFLRCIRNVGEG